MILGNANCQQADNECTMCRASCGNSDPASALTQCSPSMPPSPPALPPPPSCFDEPQWACNGTVVPPGGDGGTLGGGRRLSEAFTCALAALQNCSDYCPLPPPSPSLPPMLPPPLPGAIAAPPPTPPDSPDYAVTGSQCPDLDSNGQPAGECETCPQACNTWGAHCLPPPAPPPLPPNACQLAKAKMDLARAARPIRRVGTRDLLCALRPLLCQACVPGSQAGGLASSDDATREEARTPLSNIRHSQATLLRVRR
jgi:hypothetical protein